MRPIAILLALAAGLSAAEVRPLTVAVVPKGTTHEFWKAVNAGAVKAEREFNAAGQPLKVVWKGPLKEDDRTSQIDVVQGFVARKVSAIVLAPLDSKALVAPAEMAVAAGIPLVVIDSALDSPRRTAFVATDNRAGGALAAGHLVKASGGTGKVIVLRYLPGSASTEAREAGFLDGLKAAPGLTVLSSDQHAGATRESALTAAQNLLNRYKGEVTAVFTSNESCTAGMMLALKQAGLAGKVLHVGFDASAPLIDGLRARAIGALVVQDPFQMGYLGVVTAVRHLRGEAVQAQVDTPAQLVTPDNLEQDAIKALLNPPLEQFLK